MANVRGYVFYGKLSDEELDVIARFMGIPRDVLDTIPRTRLLHMLVDKIREHMESQ